MTASDSESEGLGVGPRVELSRSPSGVRREPRQGRSRELVRAVVEAGQLLLEEADDPESVTTHHIAERAGVDIASLYRYFPNKESIFAEVFEAKLRSDAETVGAHWGTPEELAAQPLDVLFGMLVGRVLDRHVGLFELPPSFDRNHYRDFDLVDRTLGDEGETWEQLLEQRLARLLVANAHRLDVGQAERAAFFVMRILQASIQGAIARDPELLRDSGHREETVLAVLRYLGHDPGRR